MHDVNQELRDTGLKVTEPRKNVLHCFWQTENHHLSAYDIHKYLIGLEKEISLSTIYRILSQFEEVKIIEKLTLDGGNSVYELSAHNCHHDHIVCTTCGQVTEFHDEVIETRQADIVAEYDLTIDKHTHIIYCSCNKKNCPNIKQT